MTPTNGIDLNMTNNLTVSYSSLGLLNTCPRKFALRKIYPMADVPRDEGAALSLGKAVGHGVATGLVTNSLDAAIVDTWHNYYPQLTDTIRDPVKACVLVEKLLATPALASGKLQLAYLNNKPCVETSFCIKIEEHIYYTGYLDAIVQDTSTGTYLPLELKTTTLTSNIEVIFKNSEQGNIYGLVLNQLMDNVTTTYDIFYLVGQLHKSKAEAYNPTVHQFTFTKTITDRLEWLMGIKLQIDRLKTYRNIGLFPKDGSSCLAWYRPCPFYDLCNITTDPIVYQDRKTLPTDEVKHFDLYFDLQELIQTALNLVGQNLTNKG